MTPMHIRPSKGPAQGRHASACQILLHCIEWFRRRQGTEVLQLSIII